MLKHNLEHKFNIDLMVVRDVNYLKLKDYIVGAWGGDERLASYYDSSLKDRTLEKMINDTHTKIMEMYEVDNNLEFIGFSIDKEDVGFLVISSKLKYLYSFGLNVKFRNKENLQKFFDYIRMRLNNDFFTLLHSKNTRAINWLKKCGMEEIEGMTSDLDLVYLKYISNACTNSTSSITNR